MLSRMYSCHYEGKKTFGVDLSEEGGVLDMQEHSILDSLVVKQSALRLASDAALTVLRVDQIIMSKQAGGPKVPKNNQNWDED